MHYFLHTKPCLALNTTSEIMLAQISQGEFECTKAKVLLANSYTVSLGFLALATYFFERLIAMSMLMMAKKRRKRELYSSQTLQFLHETLNEGKSALLLYDSLCFQPCFETSLRLLKCNLWS